MSYAKQTWTDLPSTASPFSAARMNVIEQGIADGDVTNPASPAAILQNATFAPISLADRNMIGTGSPLGVVSAPVGTEFIDTANTMGASKWLKTSGTGNTGWVVTVGDTGWRALTPSTSFTTGSGVRLRRVGSQVYIYGGATPTALILGAPRSQLVTVCTLGSGFSAPFYSPHGQAYYGTTDLGMISTMQDPALISASFPAGNWAASEFLFSATFHTGNAWPTTLPGTAA